MNAFNLGCALIFEFGTILTTILYFMYFTGLVGDWKSWYTVAQNDMVNEMIRTNMVNYKTSIHFGGKYEM